jgi:glycosyltransferase involved in cell wall biosynthesis
MTKLLMVTTISATLQAFLLPFARHFRAQGWQVDAMAQGILEDAETQAAFDQSWEMTWSRNPLDPRNLMVAPPRIRDIVTAEQYDIVHVHTPVAAFTTRYALRDLRQRGKPKVIYTAHGFHFYQGGPRVKNALFLGLEKLAGRWTDYLVTINREDEATAKQHLVAPAQVRYMPGIGVDTGSYCAQVGTEAATLRVRQALGIDAHDPLFLCLAEFIPRKRHTDLLQGFARLQRSDVHLALGGEGDRVAAMKEMATELGIAPRVHFLGVRRDVVDLLQAATALVLVSDREGLPRSILEAIALGKPVVGTRIRGTQDLLQNGAGLLVEVGDVDGIAQAMRQILDDPDTAVQMGKNGRQQIHLYDLQNIIQLHEQLYAEALSEPAHHNSNTVSRNEELMAG